MMASVPSSAAHRRFRLAVVAASVVPAHAGSAATSRVDFESGPAIGTAVNDEYESTAHVSWVRDDPGLRPYRRTAGVATKSGTVAADIGPGHCYPGEVDEQAGCEFAAGGTLARLSRFASSITLYAGLFSTPNASVTVTLRDIVA
jgi:hypothetical protein